jgi:diguanylate cyclase (GGDEF)-like protein
MRSHLLRLLPVALPIAASIGLLVAVLWQRSPLLAVALVGPAAALVLYSRSARRGRHAMRLALTDPLTGLGNHRSFRERLDRELRVAADEGGQVALCVLDVDDFKRVNDRRGHPAGDELLVRIAGCLRKDGEAFRLGGDEFALLLPGRGELEGLAAAEAVGARIAALGPSASAEEGVTVSGGVAHYPVDGADRAGLIAAADERLYRAKRAGGGRIVGPARPVAPANSEAS